MAQIHAMYDDQVASELKKMTAFIRQDAIEKAREIRIKADEEFSMEKSKLVRSEKESINAIYDKKLKLAVMSKQTAVSNIKSRKRLHIYTVRQEMLDGIFDDAKAKLATLSKDTLKYTQLLHNLILEGLIMLQEENIRLRVRKTDLKLAKDAIDTAAKTFTDAHGYKVNITIDESNPLPPDISGGVIILCYNDRIFVDNTLEKRLQILEEQALPQIRVMLLGENPHRKFRD